jgi:hypothetical protein
MARSRGLGDVYKRQGDIVLMFKEVEEAQLFLDSAFSIQHSLIEGKG